MSDFYQKLRPLTNLGSNPVHIERSETLDKDTARVLMSYSGLKTEASVDEAVASTFRNEQGESAIRLAPNSAVVVQANGDQYLIDAILLRNRTVRPFNDESVAGMKVVTANVFVDDADMVWNVEGEADTRILVQAANEDIAGVLESRRKLLRHTSVATASMGHTFGEEYATGDYLAFYDAKEQRVFHGIAVGEGHVYDIEREALATVDPLEVMVVTATSGEFAASMNTADIGQISTRDYAQAYLEYMKALYSGFPEYFKKVKEAVDLMLKRKGLAA